jgi:aminoglycoside phosphotransferase
MHISISEALSLLSREWRLPLDARGVAPVTKGMSTASVFSIDGAGLPTAFLKIEQDNVADLWGEIQRTKWLGAQGIRVPAVLRTFISRDIAAVLLAELPGAAPNDCSLLPHEIIDSMARGMKAIHSLPIARCPFDEAVAIRLKRARTLIQQNTVDEENFDERNQGLTAQQIYDRLLAAIPLPEELVVIHGDADFSNLRIDPYGELGFLDCGHTGRGDRYIDLVCIMTNIAEHYGLQWLDPFFKSYGMKTWDHQRALFFSDLYELF